MIWYADTVGTEYQYSKAIGGMVEANSRTRSIHPEIVSKGRHPQSTRTGANLFDSPVSPVAIKNASSSNTILVLVSTFLRYLLSVDRISIFEVVLAEENAGLLDSLDCSVSLSNLHRPHQDTHLFKYLPSSPVFYVITELNGEERSSIEAVEEPRRLDD
jgi:hypothetical protein